MRDGFLARLELLVPGLNQDNLMAAIELSESVLQVRGYGLVKEPAARALLTRLQRG